MYRRITFITLLLLSAAASAGIGFRQSTIDLPATRPLDVAVWYPTLDKRPSETVGDNIVFRGVNVQRDATPAPGAHPVLLTEIKCGERNICCCRKHQVNDKRHHGGRRYYDISP